MTLHILLKLHKHIRLILIIILQVYQCLETQYHILAFSYFQLQGLRDFVLCTKTKHTLCNPLKMIDPLMDFTKINIYYSSILITYGETFGFRFITVWFVMLYRCHSNKPKPKDLVICLKYLAIFQECNKKVNIYFYVIEVYKKGYEV